jgi:hypothetical protein
VKRTPNQSPDATSLSIRGSETSILAVTATLLSGKRPRLEASRDAVSHAVRKHEIATLAHSQTWFWVCAIALGAALVLLGPVASFAKSSRLPLVPTPVFTPSRGVFTNVQDVIVSCAMSNATIYYTLNGRTPTTNDQAVASGDAFRVAGNMKKLKVKAWMDGMRPSKVKSAHYRAPLAWPYTNAPSLFTLPLTNQGIFYNGETVTISNSNFTAYQIYDLRSNQVANVPSGGPTSYSNLPGGHYLIESSVDKREFAIVSPACLGASFAGGETQPGVSNFPCQIYSRFRPQMWRAMGTWWRICEPADGVFVWSNPNDLYASLDDNIDSAVAAGASKVIVDATWRPTWMEGTNNDAVFITKYTEFCTALAQHMTDKYGGTVGLGIEVWNEPHYESTGGTLPFLSDGRVTTVMGSYLNVLSNAYTAIKAVNPNIEVVGAAISAPPMDERLTNFVAMGALNYMDSMGVTFKRCIPYESSRTIGSGNYWQDSQGLWQGEIYHSPEDDFDTLCRKWVNDLQGKPLYMYENAIFGHSMLGIPYFYNPDGEALSNLGISWWQGFMRAQKQVIIGRATGVAMIANHTWAGFPLGEPARATTFVWEMAGWEYTPNVVHGGRGPCPKSGAWLAALAQVNGGTSFTNLHDSTHWVYAWANPTNTTVVAWMSEGAPATGVPFAVTDVYGNALPSIVGEEPVYWTTTDTPADAAVAAFVAIGGTP